MTKVLFKIDALSEINRDIAQVFFASVFIGPLVAGITGWALPISGLILSLIFWSLSLLSSREK